MSRGYSQYAASLAENDEEESDVEYEPAATSTTEDGSTDVEILEGFEVDDDDDEDDDDEPDDEEYEGLLFIVQEK